MILLVKKALMYQIKLNFHYDLKDENQSYINQNSVHIRFLTNVWRFRNQLLDRDIM